MNTPRQLRIAQQMKRELSEIFRRELKDERIGDIVSITDVEVTGDGRHAKVFISVYGQESVQQQTLEALIEQTSRIRGEIGRRLRLRYAPEIVFRLDDSLARGARVTELIAKIFRGEIDSGS